MKNLTKKVKTGNWEKDFLIEHYITYFMRLTQSMFEYENLPKTIPQFELERILQTVGYAPVYIENGELTCVYGALGGAPNRFLLPTEIIIANPCLPSRNLKIGEDCVLFKNDSYIRGLYTPLYKYCLQLAENDISMNLININNRVQSAIIAPNDNVKKSAELFLKHVRDGEQSVMLDDNLIKSISITPLTDNGRGQLLKDHIEYHQYVKSNAFAEIGLNSNFNMKREALNASESNLNEDILYPLAEDMLQCRLNGVNEINQKYVDYIDSPITVRLKHPWLNHASCSCGTIENKGDEGNAE